jgi:hypothetical protein
MSKMQDKRKALKDWFYTILSEFGTIRISERLRRATFDSSTRQERLNVMGNPTFYCEILWTGIGEGTQIDSVGNSVLDGHQFRVNLWYEYKDADDYNQSSQALWDNILESDNGLLKTIRDTDIIPDVPIMYLYQPENVQVNEVSLDNLGKELAHFLTFTLSVR